MEIKQNTETPLLILLVDETDLKTPETGLTPTVALSKDGGAFAAPAGTVAEVGNGIYALSATADDTDTLGALVVRGTATGAHSSPMLYEVVSHTRAEVMAAIAALIAPDNAGIAAIQSVTDSAEQILLASPYVPAATPSLVIPAPSSDGSLTVCFGYTENIKNAKRAGIRFIFSLTATPAKSERMLEIAPQEALTDASGCVEITLQSGLRYKCKCPELGIDKFLTPTGETFDLLTLIP